MPRSLLFLPIFWIIGCVQSDLSSQKAGPYDIVDVSIAHCDDEGTKDFFYTLKTRKISRTAMAFSLNATLTKYELSDDRTAHIVIDQFTNSGWKEGYFEKKLTKMCTSIKSFAPVMYEMLAIFNNKGCPILQGNYSVVDYSLQNFDIKNIPVFFYNKYRLNVNIMNNDVKIGCIRLFAELVPKRKKKP